ncbi:MAG: trypsin-like peptidase domain-containing protein [Spirochaetia bacterium]|jgi:serine protease Do|nr:trypsin-like peptidase domain-containing protein [Spirochaetia bacterium]
MIKKIFILPFLFCLISADENKAGPEEFNRYFIQAARSAMPSVVNIIVYNREADRDGFIYRKMAEATGTLINADGLLVTNYHVVSKGNYYQIVTYNGRKYEAARFDDENLFLADIKTDIALLKVENAAGNSFVPLKVSAENLREGEWVIAIGNPYGLNQSISSGIVSSTGRDNVGFADIEDFIQSDVSINPGSSGGPLINLKGEMVGISTAIRTVSGGYQGISFAIPVRMVNHVVDELNRYGRVRRGWLGLFARERPQPGSKEPSMIVQISSIIKNSPADRSGLLEGDIIHEADGLPVTSLGRLVAIIGGKPVGSSITLSVARDGHIKEHILPLREKEVSKRMRDGAQDLFVAYGIEIDENVVSHSAVISYVAPQSAFDVMPGDTIVSVNGQRVDGLDELIRIFYNLGKVIDRMEVSRENLIFEVRPK